MSDHLIFCYQKNVSKIIYSFGVLLRTAMSRIDETQTYGHIDTDIYQFYITFCGIIEEQKSL